MIVSREISLHELEGVSDALPQAGAVKVTIEILDEEVGDQIEADRLPWHGLTYDRSADVLEVSVGGRATTVPVVLRHLVHHPTTVWMEEEDGVPRALAIDCTDETRTLVVFHPHPALGRSSEEPAGLAVT